MASFPIKYPEDRVRSFRQKASNPLMVITYKHLDELIDNPEAREETDMRETFYDMKKRYFDKTGNRDLPKKVNNYNNFTFSVNTWLRKRSRLLLGDVFRWVKLRDSLGIQARPKVLCYPDNGDEEFLVTQKTRHRIGKGCSFVLFCEKLSMGKKVWRGLQERGWSVNYVSLAGYPPGDIQDAVLDIFAEGDPGFYGITLHDYDIDGIQIAGTLNRISDKIMDVGVSEDFLAFTNIDRAPLSEPRGGNGGKEIFKMLHEYVDSCKHTTYDFRFLEKDKRRVELDSVGVNHGVKPFLDYIEHRLLADCETWDLRRLGVNEKGLTEPEGALWRALRAAEKKVNDARWDVAHEAQGIINEMEYAVANVMNFPEDYAYFQHFDAFNPIREDFKEDLRINYVAPYEDEIQAINDQIPAYKGDPRTANEILSDQLKVIMKKVNHDSEYPPHLHEFHEALEAIDIDEVIEAETVEVPSRDYFIDLAIEALNELRSHSVE